MTPGPKGGREDPSQSSLAGGQQGSGAAFGAATLGSEGGKNMFFQLASPNAFMRYGFTFDGALSAVRGHPAPCVHTRTLWPDRVGAGQGAESVCCI
jgi:hypothetical protein